MYNDKVTVFYFSLSAQHRYIFELLTLKLELWREGPLFQ